MQKLQELQTEHKNKHICNFSAKLIMSSDNRVARQTLTIAMTLY
jgi:hypothetical protein